MICRPTRSKPNWWRVACIWAFRFYRRPRPGFRWNCCGGTVSPDRRARASAGQPCAPAAAGVGRRAARSPAGHLRARRLLEESVRAVGVRPRMVVEMNSIDGILATVGRDERSDRPAEYGGAASERFVPRFPDGADAATENWSTLAPGQLTAAAPAARFAEHVGAVVRDPTFKR